MLECYSDKVTAYKCELHSGKILHNEFFWGPISSKPYDIQIGTEIQGYDQLTQNQRFCYPKDMYFQETLI